MQSRKVLPASGEVKLAVYVPLARSWTVPWNTYDRIPPYSASHATPSAWRSKRYVTHEIRSGDLALQLCDARLQIRDRGGVALERHHPPAPPEVDLDRRRSSPDVRALPPAHLDRDLIVAEVGAHGGRG